MSFATMGRRFTFGFLSVLLTLGFFCFIHIFYNSYLFVGETRHVAFPCTSIFLYSFNHFGQVLVLFGE